MRPGSGQGLQQVLLDARQAQVGRVAALSGGAAPEQPRLVPDHGDHDVGGRHLAYQARVEGRSPGQRRREDRRLPGGETGEALLVRDRRDAEPARGHDPPLQPGQGQCSRRRRHRAGAEHPGQLAHAVPEQVLHRLAGDPAPDQPRAGPAAEPPGARPDVPAAGRVRAVRAVRGDRGGDVVRAAAAGRAPGRAAEGGRPRRPGALLAGQHLARALHGVRGSHLEVHRLRDRPAAGRPAGRPARAA